MKNRLVQAQKKVLRAVTSLGHPELYLIGGTALAFRFRHRESEDLDFFTPKWSRSLHQKIARCIRRETGFPGELVAETTKRGQSKMAVYNFQIGGELTLKVDLVQDLDRLLHPVGKDGIASVDDIYLRKIRAAIGWMGKSSLAGHPMAGGRQTAKDKYDLWYLSEHYEPLSIWFPKHFVREDYARLVMWLRTMTTQAAVFGLLDAKSGCDTRRIQKHLEDQINDKLNRVYVRS